MLDIKFIRENKDVVEEAIKNKNIALNLDELLEIDIKRLELLKKIEDLRKRRNEIADIMKKIKDKPDEKLIKEGRELKEKLSEIEEKFRDIEKKYQTLMYLVPQIPSSDSPIGESAEQNVEIEKWGDIPKFNFEIKDHIELGKKLDIIDLERGVKVHGFRGYFLKNEATLMQMGLMMYAMNKMVKNGFTPMINPVLVKASALYGSGHFPFGREEVFQVANPGKIESGEELKDPIFLAGTAEPSLMSYYTKEIINKKELPVKICGFSSCFRSEVGSYGKDTKGLYRIHEFMKVEQVILCENDYKLSMKYFKEMRSIAEEILQDLKLPYRIVQTCTGDMGAGKYRMDDIETWMPSRNGYGETHSCSNLGDWQSRRLNIKYEDENGDKKLVHALNNTVIASPRILIAILENYQQEDGSVKVPDVLKEYVGKNVIL
ncbi:serine--tRNA ligase [Patescibacteria group bacterium]